jgi:hypothetical protein
MANSFFKIKQGLNLANYANEAALSGIPNPQVGDLVTVGSGAVYTYNGSNWVDVGSSGSVVSVNGQTGVVNLETEDIPENVNLYFTDARAQSAAVINSLAGSETDKAPSVSSVNGAIRFLPENARYVAKNGSDVTGNGSELAPFQTIQAALDSLPAPVPSSDIPECVIYVYPGVYNQALNWTRSNTHIVGMQAPRKNIQAVTIKGAIDFNIAIAEPGGIFQNISSISNCFLTNESGSRNTINFIGAERVILHLLNSQVYQAVSGYSAIYMNNTSASLSRLYADNCVIQSVANGLGHALDLVKGALWSCVNTEIYRTGAADASSRAIKMSNNSLVTGVKLSTIGSAGTYGIEMGGTGGCTVGTSVIETYSANKSGVLVAAGTALTAINCVFNVVAGTGYAVDGPAGSFFAYSANTYAANAVINPLISKIQFASDTTTSVIAEGTNQYFTAARAQTAAVVDSTAGSETNQAPSVSAMKAYVGSISSGITSVNGDTGPVVNLDSGEIPEGSNLYYTDARAQTAAVVNSTAGTEENQAPSVSAMKAYVSSISSGVTSVNGDTGPLVSLDSGEIPEGSNLYFTDARAQTAAVIDSTAGGELNQAPSVHSMKEYVTSAVATETAARESADALLIPLSQKGVADGVATLDNTGKVPASQIPPTAITSVVVVATIAERDALTPQEGDFCVVTDVNETFVYDGADWIELQVGGGITSVNGQVGPTVSLSTVDISEVTNLYFTDARAKLAAVIDSSAGSETDQAMSVAAAKMFTFDSVQTETLARQAADALLIPLSEKGAANGVATLDGSGLVPSSQLPAYPSVPVTSVNTQTGAVVLDTDDVAEGTGAPAGWSSSASLAIPRSGLGAAGTQSAALAFSGAANFGYTPSTESFNGLSWSLGGDMALARYALGGVGIQSAALAFGGVTGSGFTNSVEAYDGSSWSSAASMINVRFAPGGAGLQNAALAFGGETASGISSSSESYDGSAWAVAPSMNTARYAMAGIGIQNAAVSIGGGSNSGYSNVTETYDGASWSLSGNLSIARERLAGAGTQNAGLAFGGEGAGGKTNLTEAFNGSSWTTASNMGTVRTSLGGAGSQSAALSIGGVDLTNNNSAVTEKYNGASAANLYFTASRAQTAAVINSTAGSETDQAPSVSAMKAYVASLPSGGITSVNGDTGPAVSLSTSNIPEVSNLYFTDARAQTAAVINTTAGNETEQAASVSAMKAYVSSLPAGGVTSVNGQTNTVVLNTDNISESVGATNQWFTDARAQTAAVVNSTAGSETDQAASVSAMKSYVAASIPSGSATLTTAGYALSSSALNTQTGSYTILSSDNGRIIIVNSATAVNITVPSGLAVGFNCMVVQIGAGQVTMVASGTTLNSASGLKISAQHGALSIISYSSNVFNVAGNTAV